ncbi:MAG: hypothetical protein AAFV43_14545 [Planctomycetota bacterium]
MLTTRCLLTVLLGFLVVPLTGCGDTATVTKADDHGHEHDHDHDHGDRPESLHAAVAQLTATRDTIREAILEGDADDAHDPLHEVGELLEAIPDIASETDLPKAEWDAVKAANEELFDAFGAIDKAFHTKDGDKKAAYEGVADKLDTAIEAIRSRLALSGEDPDDHDHDHDEHDHDHEDHDDETAPGATETTESSTGATS